jgi:hypothetical protein
MPTESHRLTYLSARGMTVVRRAIEAGKASRFKLRELFPFQAAQYITALSNAIEAGAVEQVAEGCGRWFYRVTKSGLDKAKNKRERKRK